MVAPFIIYTYVIPMLLIIIIVFAYDRIIKILIKRLFNFKQLFSFALSFTI
jgi:hypothetical protein